MLTICSWCLFPPVKLVQCAQRKGCFITLFELLRLQTEQNDIILPLLEEEQRKEKKTPPLLEKQEEMITIKNEKEENSNEEIELGKKTESVSWIYSGYMTFLTKNLIDKEKRLERNDFIDRVLQFFIVTNFALTKTKDSIDKRIRDIMYNKILSDSLLLVESLTYEKVRKEVESHIIQATSLIKTFPFSTSKFFNPLLYGARKNISYEEIIKCLECFPDNTKDGNIEETINKYCKIFAYFMSAAKKIAQEEREKNGSKILPNWENILLACSLNIIVPKNIWNLTKRNTDAILKINKQISKTLQEMKKFLGTEKYSRSEDFRTFYNKKLEKNEHLYEEILNLQIEKIKYSSPLEIPFIIAEKKETSENFEHLIKKAEKKSNIIQETSQDMRQMYKMFCELNEEERKYLNLIYLEEGESIMLLQSEILQFQTMTKVLIIIHKLSEYFKEMDSKESFLQLIKELNQNQLASLAFMILLAAKVNRELNICEIEKELYLMDSLMKILEKNGSNIIIMRILECVEKMALRYGGSSCVFFREKKEFTSMFEAFKKSNQLDLKIKLETDIASEVERLGISGIWPKWQKKTSELELDRKSLEEDFKVATDLGRVEDFIAEKFIFYFTVSTFEKELYEKKEIFKQLLYGVKIYLSKKEIIECIEVLLQIIRNIPIINIKKACEEIAKLMIRAHKYALAESKQIPSLQDIILTLNIAISELQSIKQPIFELYQITEHYKNLLEEHQKRLQKKEIIFSLNLQEKGLSEISEIEIKMEDFHDSKEKHYELIIRKHGDEAFQKLIEERQQIAKSVLKEREKKHSQLETTILEHYLDEIQKYYEKKLEMYRNEKTINIKNEIPESLLEWKKSEGVQEPYLIQDYTKLREEIKKIGILLMRQKIEKEEALLTPSDLQEELRNYYAFLIAKLKKIENVFEEKVFDIKNEISSFQSMVIVFAIIDQANQHFSEMNLEEREESLKSLNKCQKEGIGSLFFIAEMVNLFLNENEEYINKEGILLMDFMEKKSPTVEEIIKHKHIFESRSFSEDKQLEKTRHEEFEERKFD